MGTVATVRNWPGGDGLIIVSKNGFKSNNDGKLLQTVPCSLSSEKVIASLQWRRSLGSLHVPPPKGGDGNEL